MSPEFQGGAELALDELQDDVDFIPNDVVLGGEGKQRGVMFSAAAAGS